MARRRSAGRCAMRGAGSLAPNKTRRASRRPSQLRRGHLDGGLAAVVHADARVGEDRVVHLRERVGRLRKDVEVAHDVRHLAQLLRPVPDLGGAQRRVELVVAHAAEHQLWHRVEGELTRLAREHVRDAAQDVGGGDGREVDVEGEDSDGALRLEAGGHAAAKVVHALQRVDERVADAEVVEAVGEGLVHVGVVARVEQQLRAAARDALRHRPDQLAHECLLRARAADRAEDTRRLARGGAGLACIAVGLDVDDELPRDPVADDLEVLRVDAHLQELVVHGRALDQVDRAGDDVEGLRVVVKHEVDDAREAGGDGREADIREAGDDRRVAREGCRERAEVRRDDRELAREVGRRPVGHEVAKHELDGAELGLDARDLRVEVVHRLDEGRLLRVEVEQVVEVRLLVHAERPRGCGVSDAVVAISHPDGAHHDAALRLQAGGRLVGALAPCRHQAGHVRRGLLGERQRRRRRHHAPDVYVVHANHLELREPVRLAVDVVNRQIRALDQPSVRRGDAFDEDGVEQGLHDGDHLAELGGAREHA
mmetsp:Transcript_40380/g.130209  ORF Transcript_40380/g.130209 Transcript_40380/m.130209 type:complete len:540 (+) Transcript_40380:334-1953(+)